MDFRLLGALEVSANGAVADLGPPKQRALLAILLLHAGRDRSDRSAHRPAVGREPSPHRGALDPDLRFRPPQGDGVARRRPRGPRDASARVPARHRPRIRSTRVGSSGSSRRGRDSFARATPREAPRPCASALRLWRRPRTLGLRLRGVRPALHPSLPRPAPRCDRAGRGRRAGGRARRRGGADAGRRDPRGSAARAIQGAAHARPLPQRAPRRGAAHLPAAADDARRRARPRSIPSAPAPAGADPPP